MESVKGNEAVQRALAAYVNKKNRPPETKEEVEKSKKQYKFWKTQPVTDIDEVVTKEGKIVDLKETNYVIKKLPSLPNGFVWCDIDVCSENNQDLKDVSELLDEHYVEDMYGEFRLHYSPELLKWYFEVPNNNRICFGVRTEQNNKLVAFISAVRTTIQINRTISEVPEINFMCIHQKLRNKGLAPVLIKEVTRRAVDIGYNEAFYTAVRYLPKPFATVKYYHRALNLKKLLDVGFTQLSGEVKFEEAENTLRLPTTPRNKNLVKMEEHHIEGAMGCLNRYLEKYTLHPIFSFDEFKHTFYGNDYVTTYVLLDSDSEEQPVVDMASYYYLPHRVLKNNGSRENDFLKEATLFYYSTNVETNYRIICDMMIVANNNGMDVFNATDIMENDDILSELHFEAGTGRLHYYFYNFKVRDMVPSQIGKITV